MSETDTAMRLRSQTERMMAKDGRLGLPRRTWVRNSVVLLAAALLAPTSVYLDYAVMNPPMNKLLALVLLSFALLSSVTWMFRRRSEHVAIMIAMWWVVISTFGRLLRGVESGLLRILLISLVLALITLIARAFRRQISAWIVPASLISVLATLGQMVFLAVGNPGPSHVAPTANAVGAPATASFYLIVVDGYSAPTDSTEGVDEFLGELEREGFRVSTEAVANYVYTHASISNLLSLDHRFKHGASVASMFHAIQGANAMRSLFERSGFRYVHVESGWSGSRCGPTIEHCIRGSFVDSFVWQILQLNFLTAPIEDNVAHPYVAGVFKSLEAVRTHALSADGGRDFVFAHLLLPHPPLQLNRDCDVTLDPRLEGQHLGVPGMNSATQQFREAGFRQQRACLNLMLLDVLRDLPVNANVVITADHGTDFRGQMLEEPEDWDMLDIRERFHIFHASRLSPQCEEPRQVDLMNLIRSEVACAIGEPLGPVDPYFEITPYFTTDYAVRVVEDVGTTGRSP